MRIILYSIIITLLISCSSTIDIINKAKSVDDIVINSEAYDRITYVELSSTDLMVLNHARNKYLSIRERWKGVLLEGEFHQRDIVDDYNLLVQQYNIVVNLINKNYSKYSKEDIEYFNEVSKSFVELDNTIDNFYDSKKLLDIFKELVMIAGGLLLK